MLEGGERSERVGRHSLTAAWVEGFKPGDAVAIKVDPAKPEDSLLLGPG